MAELIRITGAAAIPGGVLGISKHDTVFVLVETECMKEIKSVSQSRGDDDIRSLKMSTAIRLDQEDVERFRNRISEAKAMQGEIDPRQGSTDDLPVGDDE